MSRTGDPICNGEDGSIYLVGDCCVHQKSRSPDAVLSITMTGRNDAIAGIEEVIAPLERTGWGNIASLATCIGELQEK